MTTVQIFDRPCGWGKTTEMIKGFQNLDGPILCVAPRLSECERVIEEARKFGLDFSQPGFEGCNEINLSKSDHVVELIKARKNIVCTHELFYRLGRVATVRMPNIHGKASLLAPYNLVIDEVINPFEQYKNVKATDFKHVYTDNLLEVAESGLVSTTDKWDKLIEEGVTAYPVEFYDKVKSGGLRFVDDGLLVLTIPLELLTKPKEVKVLTFLSEGSFFRRYIEQLIEQGHDLELEIDELTSHELRGWKQDVRKALTIEDIPALHKVGFSYGKQTAMSVPKRKEIGKSVSMALYNLGRRGGPLTNVVDTRVMVTCAKTNWYGHKDGQKPASSYWSAESRMFGRPSGNKADGWTTTGAQFVPNTTRGINTYSDCSHAIYLYDQYPNPQVSSALGFNKCGKTYHEFASDYALTELVQWLFRCRIRKGGLGLDSEGNLCLRGERQTATVYIPSARMRNLLIDWLYED